MRTIKLVDGLSVDEQQLVVQHCDAVHCAWAVINPGQPLRLDWFERMLLDKAEFRAIGREMHARNARPSGGIDPKKYFSDTGSMVSAREDLLPVFRQCVILIAVMK